MPYKLKILTTSLLLFFICSLTIAQTSTNWRTTGNTASNSDFFGTLNNQPLIFYTNGIETMRLKANGELRINTLGGTGNNFVFSNSSGVLYGRPFTNDTNKFLTEAGTFRTASSFTGWKMIGTNIHSVSGTFVGIGNTNPQYILDVNGDVHFNGIVNATGLNITNKLQADTIKGAALVKVNNTLNLTGGTFNSIYTSTGDLRLQSNGSYAGNTLLNAGASGNVGIGTFSPQYKLDVNGDVRLNAKTYALRILPLPGDSEIHFGDSSLIFVPSVNNIHGSIGTALKGLGLGERAYGAGLHSTGIGYLVKSGITATNSITMGTGTTAGDFFINNIPNSLAVTFNSNIPTFFVATANGTGTVGKVGVGTANPQALFQVGDGVETVSMGPANSATTNLFSTSYIGFNTTRMGPDQWQTVGDGSGNGGVVLLNDFGGGLRIVGVQSNGGTNQTLTDRQIQENTKLFIRNDGRVIIGSPTPTGGPSTQVNGPHDVASTKLTVDGTILCRELYVTQNNWADSVFSPNFYLLPLDSVQAYLDSLGHLPGVPSEQEVQQNGSNLGQTDVILLAKIEELTLYMIQLQKQNAAMQKELEELKKK